MLVLSISGCEENVSEQNSSELLNLNDHVEVKQTTESISEHLINAGVIKIEVVNSNNKIKYNPITVKEFGLNGYTENLSDYSLIVNDEYAYLENKTDFKLTLKNEQLYVRSASYQGYVEETSDEFCRVVSK